MRTTDGPARAPARTCTTVRLPLPCPWQVARDSPVDAAILAILDYNSVRLMIGGKGREGGGSGLLDCALLEAPPCHPCACCC